jgi:O-antigen/teichoic acid export membrane protein
MGISAYYLVPFEMANDAARATLVGALFGVPLLALMASLWGAAGGAVAIAISEGAVLAWASWAVARSRNRERRTAPSLA